MKIENEYDIMVDRVLRMLINYLSDMDKLPESEGKHSRVEDIKDLICDYSSFTTDCIYSGGIDVIFNRDYLDKPPLRDTNTYMVNGVVDSPKKDHYIMNVYDSISAEKLTKLLNKGYKVINSTPLENGDVQYIIGL